MPRLEEVRSRGPSYQLASILFKFGRQLLHLKVPEPSDFVWKYATRLETLSISFPVDMDCVSLTAWRHQQHFTVCTLEIGSMGYVYLTGSR